MRGKTEEPFEALKRELPDKSWNNWLEWSTEQVQVTHPVALE